MIELTGRGEIFKEQLVPLKLEEFLKTEPTFRKEPNIEIEQVIMEKR